MRDHPVGSGEQAEVEPPLNGPSRELGGIMGSFCISGVRKLSLGTLAAGVVLVSALLPATPAHAVTVTCGKVINTSITVSNDLTNCLGNGLVIGANDITVNLNGKVIDGTGLGVGIKNTGFANVTIRNGTVQEFDYGIVLNSGTTGNVVEQMTLSANEFAGVQLSQAHSNTIRNIKLLGQLNEAIQVIEGSSQNLLMNNTIRDSKGEGVLVLSSNGNRLEGNKIVRSSDQSLLVSGSQDNTIVGNSLLKSGDAGLTLENTSGSNLITGNIVKGSSDQGIWVTSTPGFTSAGSNLITGNTVNANGDVGIWVTSGAPSEITNNVVNGNFDKGIWIISSGPNTITGNTVNRSGDAGVYLESTTGNTVTSNTLKYNGDAGIYLDLSDQSVVESNLVRYSTDGAITLSHSNQNTVRNNDVRYNNSGLEVNASAGNLIESNNASSSNGIGIEIEESNSNDILTNISHSNGAVGLSLSGSRNLVSANKANYNGSDGMLIGPGECTIDVCTGNRIKLNIARFNAGWGIHAAAGNSDKGGNKASGNAEPAQCFGVTCS
jgi:parallel beta-helix repeat protein